jgi:hypothetical protein
LDDKEEGKPEHCLNEVYIYHTKYKLKESGEEERKELPI